MFYCILAVLLLIELNRSFANKENCEKSLGHILIPSRSSHFFNKTDFEQYLFKPFKNEDLLNVLLNVQRVASKHSSLKYLLTRARFAI